MKVCINLMEEVEFCSMEDPAGDGTSFPLLEDVLATVKKGEKIFLAYMFLAEGRHAGKGGDIDQILEKSGFSQDNVVKCTVFALEYFVIDDISFNDFMVTDKLDTQNYLALNDALGLVDSIDSAEAVLEPRSESLVLYSMSFIFYSKTGGQFLTPENVKNICELEVLLTSIPSFKEVCATNHPDGQNTTCDKQAMFLSRYMYLKEIDAADDCVLLTEAEIKDSMDLLETQGRASSFFDNAEVNGILHARSQLTFAGPIGEDSGPAYKRFNETASDFDGEQAESYKMFYDEFEKALFKEFNLQSSPFRSGYAVGRIALNDYIEFRVWGLGYEFQEFRRVVNTDQALSMGSAMTVGILMSAHIGSGLLTFLTMVAIQLSIVIGLLVYKGVFGIMFFTNIHIVVIFIILGVGADNFFCLNDAYAQASGKVSVTASDPIEFRVKKMQYAYYRAGTSVINTSLTTSIAFAATGVSPIKPIAAFGYFAALVLLVNLLYMFTIHPANLIVIEISCKKKPKLNRVDNEINSLQGCNEPTKRKGLLPQVQESYLGIIKPPVNSMLLAIVFAGLGAYMATAAWKLETPAEQESNFRESHMFTGFQDDFNSLFSGGSEEEFVYMKLVFGISGLDQEGVIRFGSSSGASTGSAIFSSDFSLGSTGTVTFLLDFCAHFKHRQDLVLPDTLSCFIEDFETWHNFTYSVSSSTISEVDFRQRLKFFLRTPFGFMHAASVGFIDDDVRFIVFPFRAVFKVDLPLQVKQPVLALYEEFSNELNNNSSTPTGFRNAFQTSFDTVWAHSEQGIVDGLFQGMKISAGATFVVLLLGTQSVLLSLYALTSVGFIVCCVLGITYKLGWALSTMESIASIMCVGLSVDYILHLAHCAKVCEHESKDLPSNMAMVEFAVKHMGSTVVAGAITTGGSTIFLFLCQMAFFSRMAVLISLTVTFSILYSFLFFLPICRLVGPGKR
eukprot:augustus_masked-scaffold_5-processed-gene-17.9-mRNA-1 protein AED:1.00 eAED:1.00 QI:0/0/0/0/1/1/2/0/957